MFMVANSLGNKINELDSQLEAAQNDTQNGLDDCRDALKDLIFLNKYHICYWDEEDVQMHEMPENREVRKVT